MVVVLREPKLIFIEEPRTASRSTHIWLVKHMGGLSPWPPIGPKHVISPHNTRHMGPAEFKDHLRGGKVPRVAFLRGTLRRYDFFAFTRNPFSTLVSYWCKAKNLQLGGDPSRRAEHALAARCNTFKEYIQRLLKTRPGTLDEDSHHARLDHCDYALRFEDGYPEALFQFLGTRGLPVPRDKRNKFPHTGKTRGKSADWRSYYDDEMIEIVAGIYPKYLAHYNYSFDSPG